MQDWGKTGCIPAIYHLLRVRNYSSHYPQPRRPGMLEAGVSHVLFLQPILVSFHSRQGNDLGRPGEKMLARKQSEKRKRGPELHNGRRKKLRRETSSVNPLSWTRQESQPDEIILVYCQATLADACKSENTNHPPHTLYSLRN